MKNKEPSIWYTLPTFPFFLLGYFWQVVVDGFDFGRWHAKKMSGVEDR
jgi:hypothetical protein